MKHRITIALTAIAILLLWVLKVNFWWFSVLFLLFLGSTALGVANIQLNYFVKSSNQNKNINGKKIALTFDDGPTEFTPLFMDILKNHDVKATFFCIGKQIEKHPEIFKQIIAEGHEIGSHTYRHSHANGFFSTKKIIKEIEKNDQVIRKFGVKTMLFRPPFGITNPNIAKAIFKTGKKSIGWNVRSFDTAISDENKILRRITKKLSPGSVILMHDTSEKSANVLQELLLILQREDYKMMTVSELFNFNKK